jgi:hypothetical protein
MNSAFGNDKTITEMVKTSTSKASKTNVNLDPILEEAAGAIVPYQPNLTIHEQRAKKNELLKQRVKKLTNGDPVKALPPSTTT